MQAVLAAGQQKSGISKNLSFEKRFYNIFVLNSLRGFEDSVAIYSINFRVTIVKNSDTQTVVTKIVANDSLGYKVFPRYKDLEKINFTSLLGTKNEAVLVIPILIHGATTDKIRHRNKNGDPLINMQAAINAAYALYSDVPYNNIEDSEKYLPFRLKDKYNNRSVFEDVILARPLICDITVTKN